MTIGERIKTLRSSLGISQVAFADKINVSKQTLYKYENDIITNIPSDKIEAIANLTNVSPAYLMGWINPEDENIATRFNKQAKKCNLSFLDIAKKTSLDVAIIKKVADGFASAVTPEHMALIANAIHMDYFVLMGWQTEEEHRLEIELNEAILETKLSNLLDNKGKDYKEIFDLYSSLNKFGKKRALDTLRDLAKLYYVDNTELNAAHKRTDIDIPEGTDTSDDDAFKDF